jgi:hypothetical protein
MRNLKLIALLIFIGIYSSCSNDDNENNLILTGIYIESMPFSGTHQLNFVDNNTLILKARNSTDEEFIYELSNNMIKLSPIRDLSQTWELEINLINNSKFEITNIFYASIPEDDDTLEFVTFEK